MHMFVSVTYSCPHNILCLREIDTWLDRCCMRLLYASYLYMQTMMNPHRVFQCSWVCECASVRPCECMYYSCVRYNTCVQVKKKKKKACLKTSLISLMEAYGNRHVCCAPHFLCLACNLIEAD